MTQSVIATTTLYAMETEKSFVTRSVTFGSSPALSTGTVTGDRIAFGIVLTLAFILTFWSPFVWRTSFELIKIIGMDKEKSER